MHEIICNIKTYLKENYGSKQDFLMLQDVSAIKPTIKPIQAPPPPKKETPPKEVEAPPPFITEKLTITTTPIANEMHTIYKKIAPHMPLTKTPPDDVVAKQIRTASLKRSTLPEIPIFSDLEHKDFLTQLATAIHTHFGTSSIVSITEFEEKNLWKPLLVGSNVRLIILPETLLKHSPNLLHLTKEYPGRVLKSIEKIPLLALTDLRNTPIRKKEIWSLLQRFFKQ